MASDRKYKSILLDRVDRQLFDAALAKCRAQEPPIALKWQIVSLVKAWLGKGARKGSTAKPPPEPS